MASALIPVLQAQTLWTNAGTGDWTIGTNWSAGVPNSSTDATIENGGTATLSGAGLFSANNLFVGSTGGNGTLSITGGSLAVGVHSYLGYNGGIGAASISGGSWSSAGQLLVGAYSNATLSISGGNVTAAEGYIGFGSTSTATVSDGTWNTAGILLIGHNPGLAANGTLTVNGGAVSAGHIVLADALAARGNINLNGGTLSTNYLTESNGSGGGHLTFNGGTLRALRNENNFFLPGGTGNHINVQILSGGATINTNSYNIAVSAPLQGVGGLIKTGNGKLTLSGASTYTGATVVNVGTLELASFQNISRSTSITVNTGATLTAQNSIAIGSVTAGVESLSLAGGAITITGTSSIGYSNNEGSATVTGGTWNTSDLVVGHFGNGSMSISNAVVTVPNSSYVGYSSTGTTTINSGAWNTTGYIWIGVDAGGSAGIGTVNVNGGAVSAEIVQMAEQPNSTGNLNLNGGVLSTQAILEQGGSGGGHINFNGGELRALTNQDFLQGFETGDVQILAGNAIINTNGFNIGISPVIQGVGGLIKTGNGILTLSGSNAYTGGTVINQGTLSISHYNNISSSSLLTVNTGGTFSASDFSIGHAAAGVEGLLLAGGTITTTNSSYIGFDGNATASVTSGTWTSGGVLSIGDSGSVGTLSVSGGAVSASLVNMANGPTAGGTLNLNGGTLSTGAIIEGDGASGAIVNINGGTIRITASSTLFQGFETGNVQILGGGATINTNGFNSTIPTAMQGVGGLIKNGAGQLTLAANNTFSGQTIVNAGTLNLAEPGALHKSNSIIVNTGGALTTSSLNIGNFGTGTETLAINGGSVTSGQSTIGWGYEGSVSMTAGTWNAGSLTVGLGGSSGDLTISGGVIIAGTSIIAGDPSTPGNGTATISSGSWTSSANLFIGYAGEGQLTMNGGSVTASIVYLSDRGTSRGTLNLNSGTLSAQFFAEGTSSNSGTINFNGGTVRATINIGTFFQGFENGDIQIASGGATFDTQAFNISVVQALQGAGGITKTGSGRLTLTGTSTYTGATMVSGGTLKVGGSISTSLLTTIADGATLTGSGAVGSLTVGQGGTLSPGDSPGTLDAGNTTFGGGGSYLWEINNAVGTVGAISGWDLLEAGSISIGATVVNPFIIDITSLTLANASGNAAGFDPNADYTFMIASASSGISGFHADKFQLVTSDFSNPFHKSWSISSSGSAIYLTYGVVPEPFAPTLAGLSAVLLLLRRRRGTR